MQQKIVYKNKFTIYPFVRNYYLFLENKTDSWQTDTTGLGGIGIFFQIYKLVVLNYRNTTCGIKKNVKKVF